MNDVAHNVALLAAERTSRPAASLDVAHPVPAVARGAATGVAATVEKVEADFNKAFDQLSDEWHAIKRAGDDQLARLRAEMDAVLERETRASVNLQQQIEAFGIRAAAVTAAVRKELAP